MKPNSDKEILDYFRSGYEDVAFRLLLDAHGKKIYNIALFTLNDEILAEDATQDAFIKIYRGLHKFRSEAKLSTWIYRIVKNVCYDYLNQAKKTATDRLNGNKERNPPIDYYSNPEDKFAIKWRRTTIRNAVQNLPKDQRIAITLYYFYEQSYKEIAGIMDQPLGTIKSHLHRAKTYLAKSLLELKEEKI